MNSKKQLEIKLSKLTQLDSPDPNIEQYTIPSNIAAEVLWIAHMNNDIKNKVIADLGCGNGILGIGSLLLGARKVFLLDSESNAILTTKKNLRDLKLENYVILREYVENFDKKVDLVIQNPPFGVQIEHADRIFLIKAMENSRKIYSLHKLESKNFIEALARDNNFKIKDILTLEFPIKKTQKFHTKKQHTIKVSLFILEKL